MNLNELKELIQVIDQSGLSSFHYHKDGLKLKIEKGTHQEHTIANRPYTCAQNESSTDLEIPKETKAITNANLSVVPDISEKPEGQTVKSPLVGIYYASPTPTSAPYITVGQHVKTGDTLCIVEAMKVMNEITAELDGIVLEICPVNESLVEFGQPLVRIG